MTETKIKEESSNEGVATEMAQKKTDGLLKKLVEITAKVERIPKNGWNDRQKYHYALESDIKDVVRKEMSERGLVLVPSELNRVVSVINTKSGGQQQIVSLEIEYTIYDAETGEKITFRGYGDGQDSGDKAVYKAKTGALKYALTNLFMIPTGDDPEAAGGKPLQPKYIEQGKIDYLEKLVNKVANLSNAQPSNVVIELKKNLNTALAFEKFETPLFEDAARILTDWVKQFEAQLNQAPRFTPGSDMSNQQNNTSWGNL
ncbi:ERF family protein [Streptomyces sp. P17]|jgi:hypothetical protein|uniref:ERF family protein n=2 Tax=unclassified Streptomyces TaxID=2593676 RepID=UPI00259F25AD|nr:ERF family protein [Streptomyces sp. P17]MDM7320470.1 ERF family protein [Fervidobacterium sp.]MDT9700921.1 ERF family protein [Streptomyces sp. P17]